MTVNLRNTKQMAGTFSRLAPAQMRSRGLDGVPVRFIQCATEDAVGGADDAADALLVPVHYEAWSHFVQGCAVAARELAQAPDDVRRRFRWLPMGEPVELALE